MVQNNMTEKQFDQVRPLMGLTLGELMQGIDFRKTIQKACDDLGITIYMLAKSVGLKSPSTLYNYLNGVSSLSADNLSKVLAYLQKQTKPDCSECTSRCDMTGFVKCNPTKETKA